MSDKPLVLNLLRQSNVLEFLISKFNESIDEYIESREQYNLANLNQNNLAAPPSRNGLVRRSFSERRKSVLDERLQPEDSPSADNTRTISSAKSDSQVTNDGLYGTKRDSMTLIEAAKQKMQSLYNIVNILLEFCLDLSHDKSTASEMFYSGICNGCITMLQDISCNNSLRNPRITELLQLIWICLESSKNNVLRPNYNTSDSPCSNGPANSETETDTAMPLDIEYSISILKNLLLQLINDGYRLIDKECRNEIIIILSLVLAIFPSETISCLIMSGIIDIIVSLACIGEMSSTITGESSDNAIPNTNHQYFYPKNLKLRNFSTPSEIDLQFKRLLWSYLSQLTMYDDPDLLLCIASSPLFDTMLLYLEYNPNTYIMTGGGHDDATGGSILSNSASHMSLVFTRNSYQSSSRIVHIPHGTITIPSSISSSAMDMNRSSAETGLNEGTRAMDSSDDPSMSINESSDLEASHPFLSILPISQLRQFQILASNFLIWNASKLVKEFHRVNGPQRLLRIIHNLTYNKLSASSQGNFDLIYFCLLTFARCITTSRVIKQNLIESNALAQFLSLYNVFHDYTNLSTDAGFGATLGASSILGETSGAATGGIGLMEMNVQCIRVIGLLCEGSDLCQSQLHANKGIQLLIKSLNIYTRDKKPNIGVTSKSFKVSTDQSSDLSNTLAGTGVLTDQTLTGSTTMNNSKGVSNTDINPLIVSLLDCVRQSVVGNNENEASFALSEGIDALLDLLEVLPLLMRTQLYRLLSDILQNQQLLIFFKSWKSSKTLRTCVQLLCHGWLDEELRLHSIRQNGVISNLWDPLHIQDWPTNVSIDYMRESLSTSSLSEVMPLAVSRLNKAINMSHDYNINSQNNDNMILHSSSINMRNPLDTSHHQNDIQNILQSVLSIDSRGIIASILNQMNVVYPTHFIDHDLNTEVIDEISDTSKVSTIATPPKISHLRTNDHSFISSAMSIMSSRRESVQDRYTSIIVKPSDDSDKLSCQERQVLAIAKKYKYFRSSEWWDVVSETQLVSHFDGTIVAPIEDDTKMIQRKKEEIFNAILSVQMEQIALDQEQKELDREQVNMFHNHILDVKQQQIKSEWLKKNAKKKRLGHSRGVNVE